jgi:hypothetical protein
MIIKPHLLNGSLIFTLIGVMLGAALGYLAYLLIWSFIK